MSSAKPKTALKSPSGSSKPSTTPSTKPSVPKTSTGSAKSTSASSKPTKTSSSSSSSSSAASSVTKGIAKLKVSKKADDSDDEPTHPSPNHSSTPSSLGSGLTVQQAANARRRLSVAQADGANVSQLDGVGDAKTVQATAKVNLTRRRLSVMGGATDAQATQLDGVEAKDTKATSSSGTPSSSAAAPVAPSSKRRRPWSVFSSLSKVGYVPFNPNKVNQDRSCEVVNFGNSEEKAVFGVFDGHGAVGHEVSSYVAAELPRHFLRQSNLDSNPADAITKAFIECNNKLASSSIDCTFSGTTAIAVYLSGNKLYSCNAGDSRAVLAQLQPQANGSNKFIAVALSNDHKPERPDEKKRIIENRGRVEACKGMNGEDIGPARVWLLHQDVPGLAMSRSFGDLIAASVGVISKPDVWERELGDNDKFMILASDGVWEFISSQEAVDIVAQARSPEEACRILVDEAVKRWHAEEEVVDDITCLIVYF